MAEPECLEPGAARPYLEYFPEPGGGSHCVLLDPLPFLIGRGKKAHYLLESPRVSKEHAEVVRADGGFHIRDLGSTNGTFVNGQRVAQSPLVNGDIVHLAHKEFRFSHGPGATPGEGENAITESSNSRSRLSAIRGGAHLRDLVGRRLVRTLFQPIVFLGGEEVFGYEALGRGAHDKLSALPGELFALAERYHMPAELSRVFRGAAAGEAHRLPGRPWLFLNSHPLELGQEAFFESLKGLPDALGGAERLVLEVHEDAAADVGAMRRLRERLKDLGLGLAYDDFGAGQSRLAELTEVPPDFIKLDLRLVRGIDKSRARQELVRALNRLCEGLGVRLIAEGVETREEADTCRDLGCRFGQGFCFGYPRAADAFSGLGTSTARVHV